MRQHQFFGRKNGTSIPLLLLLAALVLSACASASPAQVTLIGPQDYKAQFGQGADHELIDVRTPQEFAGGHIQGAINIPVESLAGRLDEVPQGKPIVVYCRSGNRSATAADILVQNGYQSVFDLGGIQDWIAQGFAVE
jgi:rhodanese-related sulfurtransferase